MSQRLAAICSCATIGMLSIVGLSAGIGASASAADTSTTSTDAPTTSSAPVTVGTTSVTLPLFGAQLTIDISTGPDGSLTKVFVNPASAYTADQVKPNKVSFESNDGEAKVTVTTKHGIQAVTARTSQLADIVGPGSWTGDVFGSGVTSTVNYEIAAATDGSPDIINVTTADPNATIGDVKHGNDDDRQSARVAVTFVSGLRSRVLVIRVGIGTHDGESHAVLEIALLREKPVDVPLADAVGPHSWDGVLCDGSAAQIKFVVGDDGSLSGIAVTPDSATIEQNDHGVQVKFSDHERVRIRVKTDGTDIRISVEPKLRCDNGAPEVNTATTDAQEPGGDNTTESTDAGKHDGNGPGKHDGTAPESSEPGKHDGTAPGSSEPGKHDGTAPGSSEPDNHAGNGSGEDGSTTSTSTTTTAA
jgi:hypothetical protein